MASGPVIAAVIEVAIVVFDAEPAFEAEASGERRFPSTPDRETRCATREFRIAASMSEKP